MIKKRNLDNSLIQWIMTVTNLGPGVGELFWVAPSTSATSQFKSHLTEGLGVSEKIYAAPDDAEDATVAARGDVVLVMPGAYDTDTEIDWDKQDTHMIGLGGPNVYGDYSEYNVVIYTDSTSTVYTVDISGKNCQFHNLAIANLGANAGCLAPVRVNKHGLFFSNVRMQGTMTSQQAADADCASLIITGDGFYPQFHNCIIGENEWATRTAANSGQLLFPGAAGAPSNGLFKDCRFILRSDTATTALVAVSGVDYIGRAWLFDNCFFHCESADQTEMNRAFYMNTSGSDNIPSINLHQCFASNFAAWQTDDNDAIEADMPITGIAGGIGQQPDGTVGS